jgi:tripartite-type tricarboxylate transporter receptor subunit TctC
MKLRLTIVTATAAAAFSAAFSAPHSAHAQADAASGYPKQPIKIVVGFTPGGSNDLLARLVAQKFSERLGQPGVVENKPGAGALIGTEFVVRSPPDGYTILMAPAGTLTINPAVYSKLPYDSIKSFEHIALVATYPFLLSVNAGGPIKSVKDLIDFAKANPSKANYGSTSTIFQLTSELFNSKTGVKFEHIPFKSGGEIVTAILSGQVTMAFADTGPAMPQIRSGKLRALATSGTKRFGGLPDLPTMKEAGINGVEVDGFSGLVAPAGTPKAIVKKLEAEVNAIVKMGDVRERMSQLGLVPAGGTGEEFRALIERTVPIWKEVAKASNIKLD